MSRRATALAILLGLPAGCTQIEVVYGQPPAAAAELTGVTAGLTTEQQLVARLGPPDEYLSPPALGLGRAFDEARRRVDQERDLFGRRVLTWACETRHVSEFSVPPRVPLIWDYLTVFRITDQTSVSERLVVLLDEQGVVEAVGRERPAASR
jgi:hypothetical protein